MKSCALWAYVGHDLEDMTAHQETSPAHRLLIESLFFWSEDCCVEEAVSSATWPRGTLALSRGILLSIRSPGEADGCLPPLSEHRIWRAKSCSAETNASSGIRCALLCMVLYKGRLTHNRLYQRAVPPTETWSGDVNFEWAEMCWLFSCLRSWMWIGFQSMNQPRHWLVWAGNSKETPFLLPDFIGNFFHAYLRTRCCQGKYQMLPVYTCFT